MPTYDTQRRFERDSQKLSREQRATFRDGPGQRFHPSPEDPVCNTSGIEVSKHLKWIANEFPVTLLVIGVGLAEKGLFGEGDSTGDAVLAQTGRRTTCLGMRPFSIADESGRREWRQVLLTLEQRVVLADKHSGMLADELSDYLFARGTGHIGSLMTLINRGCQRAVRRGEERLTQQLLDRVRNDEAAENARRELDLALHNRRLNSQPHSAHRESHNGGLQTDAA